MGDLHIPILLAGVWKARSCFASRPHEPAPSHGSTDNISKRLEGPFRDECSLSGDAIGPLQQSTYAEFAKLGTGGAACIVEEKTLPKSTTVCLLHANRGFEAHTLNICGPYSSSYSWYAAGRASIKLPSWFWDINESTMSGKGVAYFSAIPPGPALLVVRGSLCQARLTTSRYPSDSRTIAGDSTSLLLAPRSSSARGAHSLLPTRDGAAKHAAYSELLPDPARKAPAR